MFHGPRNERLSVSGNVREQRVNTGIFCCLIALVHRGCPSTLRSYWRKKETFQLCYLTLKLDLAHNVLCEGADETWTTPFNQFYLLFFFSADLGTEFFSLV